MSERSEVKSEWDKTQDAAQERALDAKIEKHFKSHPELRNGRNFRHWNREWNPEDDRKFRKNFDNIFPNAPGAGI